MSEQILQQILSSLDTIQSDVAELKADVTQLKAEVTEIKSDVAELKADVTQLKAEVTEIKKDTALIPFIQRAIVETHSDVQALKDAQQEQQKILERLSYRSVAQEADIAELRHIK